MDNTRNYKTNYREQTRDNKQFISEEEQSKIFFKYDNNQDYMFSLGNKYNGNKTIQNYRNEYVPKEHIIDDLKRRRVAEINRLFDPLRTQHKFEKYNMDMVKETWEPSTRTIKDSCSNIRRCLAMDNGTRITMTLAERKCKKQKQLFRKRFSVKLKKDKERKQSAKVYDSVNDCYFDRRLCKSSVFTDMTIIEIASHKSKVKMERLNTSYAISRAIKNYSYANPDEIELEFTAEVYVTCLVAKAFETENMFDLFENYYPNFTSLLEELESNGSLFSERTFLGMVVNDQSTFCLNGKALDQACCLIVTILESIIHGCGTDKEDTSREFYNAQDCIVPTHGEKRNVLNHQMIYGFGIGFEDVSFVFKNGDTPDKDFFCDCTKGLSHCIVDHADKESFYAYLKKSKHYYDKFSKLIFGPIGNLAHVFYFMHAHVPKSLEYLMYQLNDYNYYPDDFTDQDLFHFRDHLPITEAWRYCRLTDGNNNVVYGHHGSYAYDLTSAFPRVGDRVDEPWTFLVTQECRRSRGYYFPNNLKDYGDFYHLGERPHFNTESKIYDGLGPLHREIFIPCECTTCESRPFRPRVRKFVRNMFNQYHHYTVHGSGYLNFGPKITNYVKYRKELKIIRKFLEAVGDVLSVNALEVRDNFYTYKMLAPKELNVIEDYLDYYDIRNQISEPHNAMSLEDYLDTLLFGTCLNIDKYASIALTIDVDYSI